MKEPENTVELDPIQVLAERGRRRFYHFLKMFWHVLVQEEPVWNWHIEYLCDEVQKAAEFVIRREPSPYDLVVNVPPGSTKSTIISQALNAWVWAMDPRIRVIGSSYAEDVSTGHAVKTRDIIQSALYRALYPDVEIKSDQNGKTDYHLTKGGQRYTTSTAGTVTGIHAHLIVWDDPIDPRRSVSEIERKRAEDHGRQTLSQRKVNKSLTLTILVMQRLHEKDPSGYMLKRQKGRKVKHVRLPADLSDGVNPIPEELVSYYKDGLLDPVRIPRSVLEDAKEDLGSFGYAGQYSQVPVDPKGGHLKRDWFRIEDWKPEYAHHPWNFAVDTAYTEDEANDPSAIMSWAKIGNEYYIRMAESQWLEFTDLCAYLPSFAHLNGYTPSSLVEVEPKASGKSVVQSLRATTDLNVIESFNPTRDKTAKVKGYSPIIQAGRVVLIRGAWNESFLDQVTMFPRAAHDEYIDLIGIMLKQGHSKDQNGVTHEE